MCFFKYPDPGSAWGSIRIRETSRDMDNESKTLFFIFLLIMLKINSLGEILAVAYCWQISRHILTVFACFDQDAHRCILRFS